MSVASEITRIQNAKASLKTSINAKTDAQHQITNETIDNYSSFVDSIIIGGGTQYTGHYDATGLAQIGYTQSEIAFYQENGVFWNEEDDNDYKLTTTELAGDETQNTRFIPKNTLLTSFSRYRKIMTIPKINTSSLTSFESMFSQCVHIKAIDTTDYSTSNITNMKYMFMNCRKLEKLDLSSFSTANITDFTAMFSGCSSLKEIDLSSFNTSNTTNFMQMFTGCYNLEEIDLSSFSTAKATNISQMFSNCQNLRKLNLSNFYTSRITNMTSVFLGCYNLEEIDLSNMTTLANCDCRYMFSNCYNLRKLDIRKATFSNVYNNNKTDIFIDTSSDCLIIVKNATEKNWFASNWPNLTNVKTVEEYEGQ